MKHSHNTKKIVKGQFKGKTLVLPSSNTTRSSKNIVLESFFNTLQFEIVDACFVEVFAGSGSIGLEALSRGAFKVFFMEKDKKALKILQQNIYNTDPSNCEVIQGNSFDTIDTVIQKIYALDTCAYFYIDPPFSIREGMETIYEQTIKLIEKLPQEIVKMIIIEYMTGLQISHNIGRYILKKNKKFGKTSLAYFEPVNME